MTDYTKLTLVELQAEQSALEKAIEARKGDDGKYREYLARIAREWGFRLVAIAVSENDLDGQDRAALATLRQIIEEEVAATKPTEPEWIKHDGFSTCPVPDGCDCEVKFRSGVTRRDSSPERWMWEGGNNSLDITHYRIWEK